MKLIKKYQFGNAIESTSRVVKSPQQIKSELFNKDYYDLDEFDYNTLGIQMMPLREALKYADPDTDYTNQDKKLMQNMNPNTMIPVLNGRLFSRSLWEEMQGKPKRYQFPSEEIENERIDNESQRMKQHAELKEKNPQKLGMALMAAGAAPFIPELLAPTLPYIVPTLTTAAKVTAPISATYYGSKAINDIAEGDYTGAALNGGMAAASVVPFADKLSFWPRVLAFGGAGVATPYLEARSTKHDWEEFTNTINKNYSNPNYVPTDEEAAQLVQFLEELNYHVNQTPEEMSDSNRIINYDITSNQEEYPEQEGWWSEHGGTVARYSPYLGYRAGKPIYKWATNKPLNRPEWMINLANKYPKLKAFAKGAAGIGKTAAPEALLLLPNLVYDLWPKSGENKKVDPTALTNSQKKAIFQAVMLLQRKSDTSLGSLKPEDKTGYVFKKGFPADTLPPVMAIDPNTITGEQQAVQQNIVDSTTQADAPLQLDISQ